MVFCRYYLQNVSWICWKGSETVGDVCKKGDKNVDKEEDSDKKEEFKEDKNEDTDKKEDKKKEVSKF